MPRGTDRPQQTILQHGYITTHKILGFETKQGDLKEWISEARDRLTRTTRVESRLDYLPAASQDIGKDKQRADIQGDLKTTIDLKGRP
jgi:hypothetical protein